MRIRLADEADREAVIALWEAAGLTRPWNDPVVDFDRAWRGATSAVLVGFESEALVATAMVGDDGHRGWVYYLAVREDARRRGLGREMMAAAETWLRAHDVEKVQLMVRDTNQAVRGFYEALGYEITPATVLGRWLE
jgi:ribosomal protein S18 acetylase RimI-like enzyme